MPQVLSTTISVSNALNIYHGFKYSEYIHCHLTTHVTVTWSLVAGYPRTGTIEEQSSFARKRTGEIMSAFSDFCRYRGLQNCVAYVLENSPHKIDNFKKLVHSHIAFHVPAQYFEAFSRLLPDWTFGKRTKHRHANALHIAPHSTGDTILRYLLKSADAATLVPLPSGELVTITALTLRLAPSVATDPAEWNQGPIHGKRCGLSRQIDQKARGDDAGFTPVLH